MQLRINYRPHKQQLEVHESKARFKVAACGRRWGKTVAAVNELIKQAVSNPSTDGKPRTSWYVCATYKQAEKIAWRLLVSYLPEEIIKSSRRDKLRIELTNGHAIELMGTEDPDKLRGVPLSFVVLDEYGHMDPEVWESVIRPSLTDYRGRALFIGTPAIQGSPHFFDLYNFAKSGADPDYQAWTFYSKDNPHIPSDEIEKARRELPPDTFKREFEADFNITAGRVFDNFSRVANVIPPYKPKEDDFIVGSIDPGLYNPTGAILTAWSQDGVGRIFKEYYQKNLLASENAINLKKLSDGVNVRYWVIDRASMKRDPASGLTVFQKYQEHLKTVVSAPNDPGTVWAGIDEVRKLIQKNEEGKSRLYVCSDMKWTLWEFDRYVRYKRRWYLEKNEEEKPRKLNDHIMDCIRNMVYTKPWMRKNMGIISTAKKFY